MSDPALHHLSTNTDRALAEAEALKYGDYQRLLDIAAQAALWAQQLTDFRRYGLALNHQAWAYANLSQYESSLTHAMEALALSRAYGFPDIEARAVNIIALNFVMCGVVDEALRLYEYQLNLGEQLHDAGLISMALHDMGLLWLEQENYATAADLITESLRRLPADATMSLDASVTHGSLAIVLDSLERHEEALLHAEQALTIARMHESAQMMGQGHTVLGSLYMRRSDISRAYEQVDLARNCLHIEASPLLAANIEELVSQLLAQDGQLTEASAALERAYTIAYDGGLLDFARALLHDLKAKYEQTGQTACLINVYERLTNDIPRLQKQSSDLRFAVLRTVFTLDKAAAQAEAELNKQKTMILQRLTHEFRTPLTVIQSAAELVEQYDDRLTHEQRQAKLQVITGQVKWMTVMLEDIIALFALDSETPTAKETFTLNDLASGALHTLDRYRINNSRVRTTVSAKTGSITAPRTALETVAVHLLGNALKFSDADVVFELHTEHDTLIIRIVDQGIGIPASEQANVFKPLIRGTNLDEVTGNGIGLALVSRLVEDMNGTIDLTSLEGKGTTVTVRVPVA